MTVRRSRDGGIAFAAVIVLVALNLRAFLTSSSPLLEPIRLATGIGFHAVALLTVLPMFAMGAMSLFGAAVGQRMGARGGVALGLAAIAFACASRYVAGGAAALLWSAALAGAGVGLVQALMPGVVKQAYPARIGVMTGLYSAAIMGGGGLGAMASPWVAHANSHAHATAGAQPDWHAGLAVWALLAIFALLCWLAMRRMDPAAPPAHEPRQNLYWLRCFGNRRAWLLAACFGLINGGYTSLVAWLPHFHAQQGWTAQQGGSVLALMTAAQVIAALAMPALARSRGRDLRPWLVLTLLAQLAGFCALTFELPLPAVAVAIVLGFGLGGAFALCMVLALDHLPDPAQAGALAGFMQGVGFMIAALAPFVTGWVREHTGGFTIAWAYLAVVVAVLLPLMLCFDPRRYAVVTAGLFGARAPQRPGARSLPALGARTRKV